MTKIKWNKKTFGKVIIKVSSFDFRRNEIPCFYKEELKRKDMIPNQRSQLDLLIYNLA